MKKKQGLSKNERLLKSADFKRVYAAGRRFKARENTAWICPNSLSCNRLGISIPKRKARLSSTRNRIRRLIKEVYRINKDKLKKGFDIIMMPPGQILGKCSYNETEKGMLKICKKAGILK